MVKRLRRRPLTAESGVRFPMGLPTKSTILVLFSLLNLGNRTPWFDPCRAGRADALPACRSLCSLAKNTPLGCFLYASPHGTTKCNEHCTMIFPQAEMIFTVVNDIAKAMIFTLPCECRKYHIIKKLSVKIYQHI